MRGRKQRSRPESTGSLPETSAIANRCVKVCMSYGSIADEATESTTRWSGEFVYCFSAGATNESSPVTLNGRCNF